MARDGSGGYSLPQAAFVFDTVIDEVAVNSNFSDIATALAGSIAKDGQTTPTANLPMGTFKLTGVGAGSSRTDSVNAGQVQDGALNWVDGGGTADAITADYSPAITALVDGQICYVRATAANATTTPTFSPNGLTARTIVKNGGAALVAGDIVGDGHQLILRYDLANTRWELLNPQASGGDASGPASSTDNALARFNGTGGKTIQNSGWTLDDSNNMTAAGALAMADGAITRPRFTDYGETLNAIGSIGGGTQDIDLTLGNVVSGTVDTSTTTFTFSNPSGTGIACSFTLILTNGGSQTVNWPASVDWPGGVAPTLTSSGVDVLSFFTLDAGTTWYGFTSGLGMA